MLVVFRLETGWVGEDTEVLYHFDRDQTEEELDELGDELAEDNYNTYDHYDEEEEAEEQGIEFEPEYYFTYEILKDKTLEEAEAEYGEAEHITN